MALRVRRILTVVLMLSLIVLGQPPMQIAAVSAAPTVSAMSPTGGPLAGGTAVTISGTGFVSGAMVTIGG